MCRLCNIASDAGKSDGVWLCEGQGSVSQWSAAHPWCRRLSNVSGMYIYMYTCTCILSLCHTVYMHVHLYIYLGHDIRVVQ